jgi:hypothetical protein
MEAGPGSFSDYTTFSRLSDDEDVLDRWWLSGPFDYGVHEGYDIAHDPEWQAGPRGGHDPSRSWKRWEPSGRLIDLSIALNMPRPQWSIERGQTAYALTYVFAPSNIEGEIRIVADSNAKAWLDDQLIFAERDDHHGYLEYHDGFALRAPIVLTEGWHRLLLKVSQGVRMGGTHGFVARICHTGGAPIAGLSTSLEQGFSQSEKVDATWARLPMPAGVRQVHLPGACDVWVGQTKYRVEENVVELEGVSAPELIAVWPAGVSPRGGIRFETSPAAAALGSLSDGPLRWWSGRASYRTSIVIEAEAPQRAELDLGEVGVACRVLVNGSQVGERPWPPYRIDVTAYLQVGRNELEVQVFNTHSQRRASLPPTEVFPGVPASGPALLNRLGRNGLIGPIIIRTV